MPTPPSRFAGGDQRYLRDEQYADSTRLAQRVGLHVRFRAPDTLPWFAFVGPHLDLTPDLDVLEVGCGPGSVWQEIPGPVPAGVRLTLADLSAGMVGEAVPRARATGRYAVVAGAALDAQRLPFPDRRFDRAVANHMLYHLPDPGRGVAELARVVRPGGTAVASTSGRRHMAPLGRIRAAVFGVSEHHETLDVFGAETGFPLLREHFDEVSWYGHPHTLRCTEPAAVFAYLRSMPPAEDAGPGDLARLAAAVAQAFADGGGELAVTVDAGCFVCRRPKSGRARR